MTKFQLKPKQLCNIYSTCCDFFFSHIHVIYFLSLNDNKLLGISFELLLSNIYTYNVYLYDIEPSQYLIFQIDFIRSS